MLDPFPKGHEIPPSSSIYTTLRELFRLWVLFRLKVRHSCNFVYFVCVQRPDKGVTEPDEDINTIITPTVPAAIHTGPITRARARQLNYQVLSFLGNDSNVHENMMLPKLDTFVLLTNEGPSLEKDEH